MKRATCQQLALWTGQMPAMGLTLLLKQGFFWNIFSTYVSIWMAEWATETKKSQGSTQHALCMFSRSCVPSYARLNPGMRFLCNFIPVTGSLTPSSSQQEIFSWLWRPVFCHRFFRQKKLHHLVFSAQPWRFLCAIRNQLDFSMQLDTEISHFLICVCDSFCGASP